MVFKFAIPLLQESAISFQDSFESKTPVKDARSWLYQILTKTGVTWLSTQGNGGIGIKILDDNGKVTYKDVSLKYLKVKDFIPISDPNWIPDLWDKDDIQAFEIQIGTTLFEKLENIFAINRYGAIKLNDSVIAWEKKKDVPEHEKKSHQDNLDKTIKESKKYEAFPLEKFLQQILLKPILDKVEAHEKKIMDKEFEELYPEEKEKPSLPGARPVPKNK